MGSAAETAIDIRPFQVDIPKETLDDLRRRIAATRWPSRELVADRLLDTIGPLTDPTAHGGRAEDAFHLVLPSLPGYGFSGEPTELGWGSGRTARAWAALMGRQAPQGLLGIHLNLLAAAPGLNDQLPAQSEQERAAHDALNTFTTDGFAYFLEQSTRPQTIGYGLLDSPVAGAAGQAPPAVSVPVGFTTFPGEIWASPRSWVEAVYPGLAYFNAVERGGHFAAWEEPELFTTELRAAFRSLR